MSKKRTIPGLDSSEIPVEHFEMTLVWPVNVQAVRDDQEQLVNSKLDPAKFGFLQEWAKEIEQDSKWESVDQQYPFGAGSSYAEYCYFHPFVRNFLYVSRGDIRAHHKREKSGDARNRNLEIFRRVDLEPDNSTTKPSTSTLAVEFSEDARNKISKFEIRSCWLYLFDTSIAILELNIIHRETDGNQHLSLRSAMHIQNVIRRVYAPYWQTSHHFSDQDKKWHVTVDSHTPVKLTLSIDENIADPVTAEFGLLDAPQTPTSTEQIAKDKADWIVSDDMHDWQGKNTATKSVQPQSQATLDEVSAKEAIRKQYNNVKAHREPHTNNILKYLMYPLEPVIMPQENSNGARFPLQFEHIQDDRIPLMSFIGIGNDLPVSLSNCEGVRAITNGDWTRLSQLDAPGDSQEFPYSKQFLDDNSGLQQYAYDRFWHPTGFSDSESNSKYSHSENDQTTGCDELREKKPLDWMSTRWLCSEVAFVAVGNADDKHFYMDEDAGALSHFRRHYFAMFLIATFHRASLLQYKHRLAEISDDLRENDVSTLTRESKFKQSIERLQKEFMRFRTLYWFSEVSNQIQAREMFAMMRNNNGLDYLFNDVRDDIDAAASVINASVEQRRSDAAFGLGVAAAFLAILAPGALWVEKKLANAPSSADDTTLFGMVIFIMAALYIFAMRFGDLRDAWNTCPPSDHVFDKFCRAISTSVKKRCGAWLALIIGACSFFYGINLDTQQKSPIPIYFDPAAQTEAINNAASKKQPAQSKDTAPQPQNNPVK